MKKICFVTATRAEYGLLRWLMKEVEYGNEFCLQIIATGAHLLKEQGNTIEVIREDGFKIHKVIDAQIDTMTKEKIADSMGRMACMFSKAFSELVPDYVVVLGDRYELLPIANTAFVMSIPIIHISGGDVTEGAIDDGIRNAVTMLAEYHFPGTVDSASNIIRMRASDRNVWAVGELGLDSFQREQLMSREELSHNLGLDIDSRWVLFTYHAETRESLDYNLETVRKSIKLLLKHDIQLVATYSNTDFGGQQINEYLKEMGRCNPQKMKVEASLGNRRYLSLLKQVCCVAGNSSSGIVETPVLGVPVVNIGKRQRGRHQCNNIIQTDASEEMLSSAISKALTAKASNGDDYWGDGHASERIYEIMKRELI